MKAFLSFYILSLLLLLNLKADSLDSYNNYIEKYQKYGYFHTEEPVTKKINTGAGEITTGTVSLDNSYKIQIASILLYKNYKNYFYYRTTDNKNFRPISAISLENRSFTYVNKEAMKNQYKKNEYVNFQSDEYTKIFKEYWIASLGVVAEAFTEGVLESVYNQFLRVNLNESAIL